MSKTPSGEVESVSLFHLKKLMCHTCRELSDVAISHSNNAALATHPSPRASILGRNPNRSSHLCNVLAPAFVEQVTTSSSCRLPWFPQSRAQDGRARPAAFLLPAPLTACGKETCLYTAVRPDLQIEKGERLPSSWSTKRLLAEQEPDELGAVRW